MASTGSGKRMNESVRYEDGFRLRGTDPTRMEAFVDAAFAFAVTLLVIAIGHVPTSVAELIAAMGDVPAFAASFLLIAQFWLNHRQWSRRYGIEDAFSVRLSIALVFVILIYVYPLRMLASMVLPNFSTLDASVRAVEQATPSQWRALYVTFAIGYAAISLIFVALHRHALVLADTLGLSLVERARTRVIVVRYGVFFAIPMLSLLLALIVPMRERSLDLSMPGFAYLLLIPAKWLLARHERRVAVALDRV
ncbi:MAG: TMEM175 family protein [Dokdonella sp.]|uniref:TMEM175 family protein n=1 Tax=Dokdonella sp. TaxID=2291710 RepID=UPI0025C6BC18|nr:TMEM175 family protein [Dokdonella sp.]MBZ0223866.1 TMEM175 family protein [Dokdonella sp.]